MNICNHKQEEKSQFIAVHLLKYLPVMQQLNFSFFLTYNTAAVF